MEFTCHRDTIMKEIAIANEIISTKDSFKILSNVYLEVINSRLIIKSTDLKIGYETQIIVNEITEGIATVFCEKLLTILRCLPDKEIFFKKNDEENSFNISCPEENDASNFSLKLISENSFPELKQSETNNFFSIEQNSFIEMINQTIFSVSNDETRVFMNGIYLKKENNTLTMVATDGRRLSLINKDIQFDGDFKPIIIPPKILSIVKKLGSGEGSFDIAVLEKYIFFRFEGKTIYSNLIESKYPDYEGVIPKTINNTIIVNKEDLNSALKRVSILVEDKSRRIYLDISNNNIIITSDNNDLGKAKAKIPCVYDGEDVKIALNYTYLQDPLKVIEGNEIAIKFEQPDKALIIYSIPEESYFHIIMPMNLN